MLVLNVLLALAWAAVTGEMSASNLIAGFAIGFIVLYLFSRVAGGSQYFSQVAQIVGFTLYFLWELLVATLRVAVDIVTPQHLMKPAILAIPIDNRSPAEITLLANVITLTPGTLSLDVSPDGKTLFVHVMYASEIEKARRESQEGFGRHVREVFR